MTQEPDPIQANLTFTLLLTLRMTAAKAVETSVTSTKSLSQDYTNLDDQLPQICQEHEYFYSSGDGRVQMSVYKSINA